MAKQIEFSIDFKDETHLPSPSSTPYVYFPANLQIDDLKKKFITETIDCLKIIYSCLVCYQNGDLHMFKPIAVQLRMLFCDSNRKKDNSLFLTISSRDPPHITQVFRRASSVVRFYITMFCFWFYT